MRQIEYVPTERTTLRRGAPRARYDRATVHAILDEGIYCHVSCNTPERTFCTPMVYARRGEELLLHGAVGNRTLRTLRDGAPACVNVTLLDGLVLGRSAFRTSVNYRSVTVFARAREIGDRADKLAALRAIIEAVVPGRWPDVRTPSEGELAMSMVLSLPLLEVSAKLRSGPPADLEPDLALPAWAGVIPVRSAFGAPEDAPGLLPERAAPHYAIHYRRPVAAREGR
jgi:nitroimidazol reductase NimA-like FMN-containing flavoprotein (pyridoxamine 5'-phosphate oxidase superfamily)